MRFLYFVLRKPWVSMIYMNAFYIVSCSSKNKAIAFKVSAINNKHPCIAIHGCPIIYYFFASSM